MVVTAGQLKIRDGVAVRVAGSGDAKGAPAAAQTPQPVTPLSGGAVGGGGGPIAPAGAAPVKAEASTRPPKS